jgi:hypothetical protein
MISFSKQPIKNQSGPHAAADCLTHTTRGHHPLAGGGLFLASKAGEMQRPPSGGLALGQLLAPFFGLLFFELVLTACFAFMAAKVTSCPNPPHFIGWGLTAIAIEQVCASLTGDSCAGLSALPARHLLPYEQSGFGC